MKVLHRKYQSNQNRLIKKSCVLFVKKKRKSDSFPLNQGRLRRCTEERAGNRIKERISIFLKDEDNQFHNAAINLTYYFQDPATFTQQISITISRVTKNMLLIELQEMQNQTSMRKHYLLIF